MCKLIFSTLLFAGLLVALAASYNLTMRPDHLRTSWDPETVTFTCTADSALTGCQFRWWDKYNNNTGPLLDLSRGPLSRADSAHLDEELTGYSYSGRGLWAGDCGVSLRVEGVKLWMVGCRVRAETGGWTYAWADLFADVWDPLPHTRTPSESVVLPGGEARFALKAQEPLDVCSFSLPGLDLYFNKGAQSRQSTGRHRYLGGGLGGGDCGLAVSDVSEADNGPVGCWIFNSAASPHKVDVRLMALIVAIRPPTPSLTVVPGINNITATCAVGNSRPLPQITWLLGDDVLRQDSLDDSPANPEDEWRWPWMRGSLLQRVTLEAKTQDQGKILKCRVSHVTLDRPLEVTIRNS